MTQKATMREPAITDGQNIAESDLYLDGIPHDRFQELRETPGLLWHPHGDNGFWAVSRHADVSAVSKQPEVFSSAVGHTNLWDVEADALDARRSIIDSDAPDHTRLRRLVSKTFTPRNIRKWEELTRDIADEVVDDFVRSGGGDFVQLVAAPLPIRVILAILGVPEEDADYLVELSNHLVADTGDAPSLPPDAYGNTTDLRLLPFSSPASHALFEYGMKIGEQRRTEPRDDLVTLLVEAEQDGDRLSGTEFRNMFQILIFGGNETTRTALTHGAMAFAEHPGEWQRLLDDRSLLEPAIEEVIRWATPLLHMRRTAAEDTELAGTAISAGDKVVMWYCSANRDEAVFDEPSRFDIGRESNEQYSFGGGGPHFCLGAFLARMEISAVLEALLDRGVVLEQTGEPDRIASNFVHGVRSVPMGAAGAA